MSTSWKRKYNKRRYSCKRRVPHGCSGEGKDGALGRSKWVKLSRRKLRRKEKQIREYSYTPHRTALLRHYNTDNTPEDRENEDSGQE